MKKEIWLRRNGFSENGITYCIVGDTYSIRNYLKEIGCKYSPLLKWHIGEEIIPPNNCQVIKVDFNILYDWNEQYGGCLQKENAAAWVQENLTPVSAAAAKDYQFVGEIGQRLYSIAATYISKKSFVSQYGQYTNIYTFETNNGKIIWFTSVEKNLEENQKIELTGTVKDHRIYQGENTTIMNRCIIK